MSKPLYYVVMFGKWRSMRPPVWKSFSDAMVAHLRDRVEMPVFEEYGKAVYNRPSRVKIGGCVGGKTIYWSEAKHLFVRSPEDWKLEDWKFEALDAATHCKLGDVPMSRDIFDLILQK